MGQEVILSCHCGQLTEKVQLVEEIPVGGLLCHCNLCRHVTGALTFSGIALADAPDDVFKAKLVKYATSSKVHRYFCKTCGSHPCYYSFKDAHWHACPGCIVEVVGGFQGGLEKYDGHEFVMDTVDGGLAFTIPGIPMYTEGDDVAPVANMRDQVARWRAAAPNTAEKDRVDAKCQCGRVEFSVLRPKEGGKWEGALCACRSCQLSLGQPIAAVIMHVPYDRIVWKDGTVHDGGVHKSITRFKSSDHAHRDFCPNCGASIFYATTERPGMLNVELGVVRAEDGVLAKSLVKFDTEKIYHIEDALNKELLKVVKENLKVLDE